MTTPRKELFAQQCVIIISCNAIGEFMRVKSSVIKPAMVSAFCLAALGVPQPAWSNQWTDMFMSLLVPAAGTSSSDPITLRESQITNRIIENINANKLSTAETQNLKAQLDRVKSMELNYRANGQLGPIEYASLNAELSKVETNLNQLLGTSGGGGNTYGGGTTYGGTVTANIGDIDGTFNDLKQRITRNLSSGRLTIEEAQSLKNEYDHAWNDKNQFKNNDGVITASEADNLNQSLDALKRNLANNSRDVQAWPGIDGQQAAETKRLEDGIASGRITRREYDQLKTESDRIANFEATARGNGLQLAETITLATDLKNFSQQVSRSLNNGNVAGDFNPSGWFNGQQTELSRNIDNYLATGRITRAEAEDLRADCRRLEQLYASYRGDGNLTPNEIDVLKKGYESIGAELKEKVDSVTPVAVQYPEIDSKQKALRRRIDEGSARGTIKSSDVQKLNASLSWIASVEAAFRQSGGNLERSEAERIIGDLDRLSTKIDRSASNPVQDLLRRKNGLQAKIDSNVASGKISGRSARNLRRELNAISYSVQNLNPNRAVPSDVVVHITADMDRLNTMITSSLSYGGSGYHRGGWNNQR